MQLYPLDKENLSVYRFYNANSSMFSCLIPFEVISWLMHTWEYSSPTMPEWHSLPNLFMLILFGTKTLFAMRTIQRHRTEKKRVQGLVESFMSSPRGGYVFAPVTLLICHQDISKSFHNICWTTCTEKQRLIF